jgi:hypothetical protein
MARLAWRPVAARRGLAWHGTSRRWAGLTRHGPLDIYSRTIVLLSHEEKRETTSNTMFVVTWLQWSGMHRVAQTHIGVDMDFHNPNLKRLGRKPWL